MIWVTSPDSFSGNSPLGLWVSLPAVDLDAFMYLPTFPTSAQWNKEVGLERPSVTKGGWGRKLPLARLKLSKGSIFRNSSVSNIFASGSQSSRNVLYCNTILNIVGMYLQVSSFMSLMQFTWRNLHMFDKGCV